MLKNLIAQVFSSNKLKTALTISAIFISTAILGYLIYSQKEILIAYDWNINWVLLAPIFILYTINLFLVSMVWALILGALGIKASFFAHVRNYSIANLMKRLPGTIWYVAWRTQSYNSDLGASPKLISLASGIELAVFGIATVLISLVFSIKTIVDDSLKIWGLLGILGACSFLFLPGVQRKFFSWAGELNQKVKIIDLLKWTGIYIITRFIGGTILFLVANLFIPLPLDLLPSIIGIHSLVAALSLVVFFLPSNFGFTEVGISLLLSSFIPSSIAVIIVIVNRVLVLVFELAWGAFSFYFKKQ
jgi:hypothetical protein